MKIDVTLNYAEPSQSIEVENEVVGKALGLESSSAIGSLLQRLEGGEKVRVRLTAEQFATLVLNRRNKKVEDTLKWSKAEIVSAPAVDFDFAK